MRTGAPTRRAGRPSAHRYPEDVARLPDGEDIDALRGPSSAAPNPDSSAPRRSTSSRLRDEDLADIAALSPEERREWVRALSARPSVSRAASSLFTALHGMILFWLSFFAAVLMTLLLWLIADLFFGVVDLLPPALRAMMFFAPPIFFSIWMSLRLSARLSRLERRRRMLAHLHRPSPACARCGYDLSGAAPLPERPAVTRCPECALVNPARMPDA